MTSRSAPLATRALAGQIAAIQQLASAWASDLDLARSRELEPAAPSDARLYRRLLVSFVFMYVFCILTAVYVENREVLEPVATIFGVSPLVVAYYAAKAAGTEFDRLVGKDEGNVG